METFERAIHDEVIAQGGTELAKRMGVNRTRLLDCANPNREEHRMNLQMFTQVLVHLPDESRRHILSVLLAEFGYGLVTKARPVTAGPLHALLDLLAETADVTRGLHDALADGRICGAEKLALARHIREVGASLEVLDASVKSA
ncbi:phage regulatory CII family protein [Pseudomonas sp.]|uniref:phage regulatory CII family protein n=1 Tax=Pseudomonas sp. TaxID=306 RepID=UPI0027313260|nr:phage regulatory CII family protein [Pseudomonas sp.]MDP2244039.1 Rha family transcriptional regulator [Pseudomonas sp.]